LVDTIDTTIGIDITHHKVITHKTTLSCGMIGYGEWIVDIGGTIGTTVVTIGTTALITIWDTM
jgi:hypothetical protein